MTAKERSELLERAEVIQLRMVGLHRALREHSLPLEQLGKDVRKAMARLIDSVRREPASDDKPSPAAMVPNYRGD